MFYQYLTVTGGSGGGCVGGSGDGCGDCFCTGGLGDSWAGLAVM